MLFVGQAPHPVRPLECEEGHRRHGLPLVHPEVERTVVAASHRLRPAQDRFGQHLRLDLGVRADANHVLRRMPLEQREPFPFSGLRGRLGLLTLNAGDWRGPPRSEQEPDEDHRAQAAGNP